jgi:protein TonB
LALILHLLVLMGVDFRLPAGRAATNDPLTVMLVTAPESEAAAMAEVAAQSARAGETTVPMPELETAPIPESVAEAAGPGDHEAAPTPVVAAPTPLPNPVPEPEPNPEPEPQPAPQPAPEPEPTAADILSVPRPDASAVVPISAADILASRDAEIDRLTASIRAKSSAYASRPRRKAVSTATREYRYASYMEAWRRKVEHIGNLNYPREAREQGLFGNLILHVAVRADGNLEGVRVVRSSGHKLLDRAAIRIVELAAPFAPFPPDIRAEVDVLDITRTWQFQRNNRLGWEQ